MAAHALPWFAPTTIWVSLAMLFGSAVMAADAPLTEPVGYYMLRPGSGPIPLTPEMLSNPHLAGFELRDRWSSVNPRPGVFDFSRLKAARDKVKASGKQYMLAILTGTSAPEWLYARGVKPIQLSRPGKYSPTDTMPAPWDAKMLLYYDQLVAALAKEFAADPALVKINVGGPTCNSLEMHMPAEVKVIPGADALLIEAWTSSLKSFDKRFRRTAISVNLANPLRGGDGVAAEVAERAVRILGARATLQHDGYNAKDELESYVIHRLLVEHGRRGVRIGFEQVCSASKPRYGRHAGGESGASFAWSVERARAAGAQFFDLYHPDELLLTSPFAPRPRERK